MTDATPCSELNCGDIYAECGKLANYFVRGCRCSACRQAQRDYYRANRAKRLAYQAEYHQNNLEASRAASREHYRSNPDYYRQKRTQWFSENRERFRESRRASGSGRAANHARRARKLSAFVEHVNPLVVFDRDDYICQQCGIKCQREAWPSKDYATLDHIVALVLGGVHSYENVQTMCFRCNCAKGARERAEARRADRCPQSDSNR
jgi:5-methylcytosine-specific restriction endonuclease McrA